MAFQIKIHFVDGRKSHSREARSHAAKVAKSRGKERTVREQCNSHIFHWNPVNSVLQQEQKKRSVASSTVQAQICNERVVELAEETPHWAIATLPARENADSVLDIKQEVPRTLPPMLGAASVTSVSPSTSLHGIQYMTQVFWPNFHMHGDDGFSPLLQAYCTQPLFHHYLNYTAAVHSAILSRTVTCSSTVNRLVHYQSVVIRTLRDFVSLSDVSTQRVPEWAITLVIALASMDYQQCLTNTNTEDSLFVPYLPTADWLNVFGRIRPQDSHLNVMHTLVARAGGFNSLQYMGLRGRVAWADLVQASMNARRPVTPCIWRETASTAPLRAQTVVSIVDNFSKVIGGLSPDILVSVQQLAALDALLAKSDLPSLSNKTICQLKALRNIVEYDILCLTPWMDLPPADRGNSLYAIYETVRITITTYCQSVIFPLPPHSGWHLKLLKKLCGVFELSNILEWDGDGVLQDLLIWASCIAAIVAFHTEFEDFFVGVFQKAVKRKRVTTKTAIHDVVAKFIWQECSCRRGFDVLCERAGMVD